MFIGSTLRNDRYLVANARRRQGSTGKVVAIVLGILGIVGVLCCGGFGALFYLGWSQAPLVMIEPLKSNPEMVEHIGTVKSASLNFQAIQEEQAKGKGECIVIDVVGDKGKGRLILKMEHGSGNKEMEMATLRLEDGTEIELLDTVPDFEAPAPAPTGDTK